MDSIYTTPFFFSMIERSVDIQLELWGIATMEKKITKEHGKVENNIRLHETICLRYFHDGFMDLHQANTFSESALELDLAEVEYEKVVSMQGIEETSNLFKKSKKKICPHWRQKFE